MWHLSDKASILAKETQHQTAPHIIIYFYLFSFIICNYYLFFGRPLHFHKWELRYNHRILKIVSKNHLQDVEKEILQYLLSVEFLLSSILQVDTPHS